jgi:hypothetical protein
MVTLVRDSSGTYQGARQSDDLNVKASGSPRGEVTSGPDSFTRGFFEPGTTVERIVVLTRRPKSRDSKRKPAAGP